jgi:hypothetical protein
VFGKQQIFGIALVVLALAGTQLAKIDLSSSQQKEIVPVAPLAPPGQQPLVLKIAKRWPEPNQPRTVCRRGLCAARQGTLITIGPTAKVAQQRLQRVKRELRLAEQ